MKTIIANTKIILFGALIFMAQGIWAQSKSADNSDKNDHQKLRLYVVKDENGNKEIIDKTFASREDMDEYMKQNKIEVPEVSDAPAPPTPPTPPTPPASPKIQGNKNKKVEKTTDQNERKIIIIEKEEGGINGVPSLEITYQGLSAEERAAIIQELLNQNGNRVQLIPMHKNTGPVKGES